MATTAADTRAARKVLTRLEWCEVDGALAPDARRVLGREADSLRAALGGSGEDVAAAVAEARRVATMWGVTL